MANIIDENGCSVPPDDIDVQSSPQSEVPTSEELHAYEMEQPDCPTSPGVKSFVEVQTSQPIPMSPDYYQAPKRPPVELHLRLNHSDKDAPIGEFVNQQVVTITGYGDSILEAQLMIRAISSVIIGKLTAIYCED